jgi:hypothetical protein
MNGTGRRITVPGQLHFDFHIKRMLIDGLKKGRKIFSESRNFQTIYTDPIEIPVEELWLKDETTIVIPPLEIQARVKLTLIRDKRRR